MSLNWQHFVYNNQFNNVYNITFKIKSSDTVFKTEAIKQIRLFYIIQITRIKTVQKNLSFKRMIGIVITELI